MRAYLLTELHLTLAVNVDTVLVDLQECAVAHLNLKLRTIRFPVPMHCLTPLMENPNSRGWSGIVVPQGCRCQQDLDLGSYLTQIRDTLPSLRSSHRELSSSLVNPIVQAQLYGMPPELNVLPCKMYFALATLS